MQLVMDGTVSGPKDLHVKQSRLLRDRRLRICVPDEIPVTGFRSLLCCGRIRRGRTVSRRQYATSFAAVNFVQKPCALELVFNFMRHVCRDLINARPQSSFITRTATSIVCRWYAHLIFCRVFGAYTSIPENIVPTTLGNIVGELIRYEGATWCDSTGRHIHLSIWTKSAAAFAGEQANLERDSATHTRH